ncbi:MAG: glycosyl hydrolase [Verrucomicrobiae bacterium]|nr:glycosyl hydrolase [Verrucomicrobiae bacterium]
MKRRLKLFFAIAGLLLVGGQFFLEAQTTLESGWENPPTGARLRAYWWWLNGNVTKAAITRDLEQMKAKGFGGAVLVDADGASQGGNAKVPHGPTFFTPEWRELYKHALREADRLGLEISLNIQSGWNLGGPAVSPDDAGKKYIWSELKITGGTNVEVKLPLPKARENYYRDISVAAYRVKEHPNREPLKFWKQKALQESLQPFSAPDSSLLFAETPGTPGEEDVDAPDVVDLSGKLGADGVLKWDAPAGDWQILRFGYTIGDHSYVSTSSEGWQGYSIDVYSATAFQNYWDKIVEPLIVDAGPLAGKTLKYLHTDSWEIELANWTPGMRGEFEKRRGYDLLPWLPVLAGRIVNSREASDRFLFDYRKTLGDLAIDNHYRLFRDNAHKHGIGIHPESGGPHAVPIDAQRCLGWDDAPMSEFWAWSWTHRIGDANRFFVKQPASAAHTYGHPLVFAEGFTSIGPHWQEHIWDNLKPSFDKALCEGLNVLVWHAFVCSPEETGIPGQQYFAGTHLNPKVTWWEKSAPFFSYIDRCQWMLQQGHFAADVLYYYGDHVPNFAQFKRTDPAHTGGGYDYDVITEEALLERASVKDGKIVLPDGISYRVLVLPEREVISLPVLRKIKELVAAGATVIGPKPQHAEALGNAAAADAEVAKIAGQLWGGKGGKGRVIAGKTSREVLMGDGIAPDCEFSANGGDFDYIHRRTGDVDIYFVANRTNYAVSAKVDFRVTGKVPELWNPVTGEHTPAAAYEEKGGRTFVPLEFDPCGSWFVVFREAAAAHPAVAKVNDPEFAPGQEIAGDWTVHFDPKWGGPETAQFDSLVSWTTRPEPGIKFYSGTAVYEKTFDWKADGESSGKKVFLDLGNVRELAEVKVNGKSCGILWCPPWRVEVTAALRAGENNLQVEVVNFWPNRIIGDAGLPKEQRLTQTNVRELTAKTPLAESGLFGPVKLVEAR